jgi:hypothetical protein
MNALTRTPQNTNLLQPTKFLLVFDRLPTVTYFCQSVNIPGINLGQAPINTPMLDVFAPGNKIIYNPLNVHFLVDENLASWQELHSWFRSIASPESYEERKRLTSIQNAYKSQKLTSYSDATLTILSALNNPILRVRFINMFPITLSDVIFDSSQSADDIVSADAVFMFDYFNFEDISA